MKEEKNLQEVVRWFHQLSIEKRYRFSAQWMVDEMRGISNATLAKYLPDNISASDALIKAFRAFDLDKQRFKKITIPNNGFSRSDIERICIAINGYRKRHNGDGGVSVEAFYRRAWEELKGQEDDKTPPAPEQSNVQPPAAEPLQRKKISLKPIFVAAAGVFLVCLLMLLQQYVFEQHFADEKYLPGNIVQLRQMDKQQRYIDLAPPEHYLDAQSCFPNLMPSAQKSMMVSPSQLNAMTKGELDVLTILVPSISLQNQGLVSTSIEFDNLQHWQVSKGMINLGMSDNCLASMQQVLDYGNQVEDYGIIKQTFIADRLNIKLDFAESVTAQQRSTLKIRLAQLFEQNPVDVTDEYLKVEGPLVVAYISQSMSAIMAE